MWLGALRGGIQCFRWTLQALQFLNVTLGWSRVSLSFLLASPSRTLTNVRLEPSSSHCPWFLSDLSGPGGHSETLLAGGGARGGAQLGFTVGCRVESSLMPKMYSVAGTCPSSIFGH